MTDSVLTELDRDVLIIRLNRPQHYNAWTIAMRDHLCDVMDDAITRQDVRALVFTGTGGKAFCAGQDLAETEQFASHAHTKTGWIG